MLESKQHARINISWERFRCHTYGGHVNNCNEMLGIERYTESIIDKYCSFTIYSSTMSSLQ